MTTTWEQYLTSLQNRRIAVLGLGVSHRPLVRLLLEHGCTVLGCDQVPYERLDPEVLELERLGCTLQVGAHYLDHIHADLVFRTPGMHPNHPVLAALRKDGIPITSEMDVFFQVCPCPILGVTGSDGKTTTTTLIAEMLKAAGHTVWVGGNIGTPLLPLCPQMNATDYAVVELSSFQLMDMHHSPQRAVITNLAPNHLDVHTDMDEYVEAKKNIFRFQTHADCLVVNADNSITNRFVGNGLTRTFSRMGAADSTLHHGKIFRNGIEVLDSSAILLPGIHNVENYMAAILAVEGLVEDAAIREVARTFRGVAHRIELVRVHNGVRFYNDSIASSPSRTIAGLRSFSERVILIAGGYDKQIPYDVLGPEICHHVKKLFLNGATGSLIRAAVEAAVAHGGDAPQMVDCKDFASAVRAAADAAEAGDVVLMSPASAAFDQFPNFMVRGDVYKQIIMEL